MKNLNALAIGVVLAISTGSMAQTVKVPASLDRWEVMGSNAVVETHLGKESIFLKSGGMILKDAELLDGSFEADISFSSQRGFPGFGFRLQDQNNFENFYVRPHQSGNPDATQYTPVFNGHAGWQLYHGEGYSKAFTYKFDSWHHVKIDIHGLQAEIYIDNMDTPLIKVTELKREWKGGKLGVVAGGSAIHLANFQYTLKEGKAPVRPVTPANGTNAMITQWQVSNVLTRNFDNLTQLTTEIKNKLSWSTQTTESSGTINLAKFIKPTDTGRTIIARIDFESSIEQVRVLSFGFSDFVTIYLNDKPIFSGADNFVSRDYRFLGTIGFFDKVYLPLKKGKNEIWFVVSENFGGWGVKAKFDKLENIILK